MTTKLASFIAAAAVLLTAAVCQAQHIVRLGALEIAGSFPFLETRDELRVAKAEATEPSRAAVSVRPAMLGGWYGLVATGQF